MNTKFVKIINKNKIAVLPRCDTKIKCHTWEIKNREDMFFMIRFCVSKYQLSIDDFACIYTKF